MPQTSLTRRAAIGLAAGGLLLGAPSLLRAITGERTFRLIRNGSDIGSHTLSLTRRGDELRMAIRIDIAVRVLGIRAYVYEHQNTETWSKGRLVALESRTNDDGEAETLSVRAGADGLEIEGSGYSGRAPADAVPTSYWNYGTLAQATWFSSQSGKLLNLTRAQNSDGANVVWTIGGDFSTELTYDADREWRGCRFETKGTPIVYEQVAAGPKFNAAL